MAACVCGGGGGTAARKVGGLPAHLTCHACCASDVHAAGGALYTLPTAGLNGCTADLPLLWTRARARAPRSTADVHVTAVCCHAPAHPGDSWRGLPPLGLSLRPFVMRWRLPGRRWVDVLHTGSCCLCNSAILITKACKFVAAAAMIAPARPPTGALLGRMAARSQACPVVHSVHTASAAASALPGGCLMSSKSTPPSRAPSQPTIHPASPREGQASRNSGLAKPGALSAGKPCPQASGWGPGSPGQAPVKAPPGASARCALGQAMLVTRPAQGCVQGPAVHGCGTQIKGCACARARVCVCQPVQTVNQ